MRVKLQEKLSIFLIEMSITDSLHNVTIVIEVKMIKIEINYLTSKKKKSSCFLNMLITIQNYLTNKQNLKLPKRNRKIIIKLSTKF